MAKKGKAVKNPDGSPVNPLMLDGKSWDRNAVTAIVCHRIASGNRSIITILDEGYNGFQLPDYTTFNAWLSEGDGEISLQYAKAKESQADYLSEEMIEIADDSRNDFMEKLKEGGEVVVVANPETVARSRLRIDTRKWLASKLKPKKYGDTMGIGGAAGLPPIQTESVSDTDLARQLAAILAGAMAKVQKEADNG